MKKIKEDLGGDGAVGREREEEAHRHELVRRGVEHGEVEEHRARRLCERASDKGVATPLRTKFDQFGIVKDS